MSDSILKLNLTLKGRSIRDYTFVRETVSIGRDPQADVFIDNIGVSRKQASILRTRDGWVVEDSGSANGTWLNGRKIERERLRDQDQITIGKFTLSVGLAVPVDRTLPEASAAAPVRPTGVMDQTTVLTRGQLATVLETSRSPERAEVLELVQPVELEASPQPWASRTRIILVVLLAMAAGAGLTLLLLR